MVNVKQHTRKTKKGKATQVRSHYRKLSLNHKYKTPIPTSISQYPGLFTKTYEVKYDKQMYECDLCGQKVFKNERIMHIAMAHPTLKKYEKWMKGTKNRYFVYEGNILRAAQPTKEGAMKYMKLGFELKRSPKNTKV